jgi:hypothetical protein
MLFILGAARILRLIRLYSSMAGSILRLGLRCRIKAALLS